MRLFKQRRSSIASAYRIDLKKRLQIKTFDYFNAKCYYLLYVEYFIRFFKRFDSDSKVDCFLLVATALLISIIMHEISHGYVAYWCGDDTAKVNGRLSLNPAKHFDVVGCLMILLWGSDTQSPFPLIPITSDLIEKAALWCRLPALL